jgi:hypothetical protein
MPQQGSGLRDKPDSYMLQVSPADQDGKEDKDEKGEDKDNNEEEKNGAAGEEGEDGEEEEDRSELLPAACFLWWTGFDSVSLKRCHFVVGGSVWKCIFSMFLHFERFKSRIAKGQTKRISMYIYIHYIYRERGRVYIYI